MNTLELINTHVIPNPGHENGEAAMNIEFLLRANQPVERIPVDHRVRIVLFIDHEPKGAARYLPKVKGVVLPEASLDCAICIDPRKPNHSVRNPLSLHIPEASMAHRQCRETGDEVAMKQLEEDDLKKSHQEVSA